MASYWRKTWPFHLLVLPALVLCIIFNYIPLFGVIIAFEDYQPWLGITKSAWVGLEHFRTLFEYPDSKQVIWNTLIIASFKLVINLFIPIIFALLLNEVAKTYFKRILQTLVYLPHFLSWVILGGIMIDILSTDGGIVNRLIEAFGGKSIFFLGDGQWFRVTVIISDVWKEFGFSAIIFLATLVGINPALYEAAEIDGATRWQQVIYISIPLILPIVIVVATLSLGRILDAGFDQILNLYNPLVFSHGDIIDTFVYRVGLNNGQFSFGTAVGLFKSVIGFILIIVSYRLAYKLANYRIF
ncbi:sugar ABC transporter permease [Paenibacillus sp. CF384]|uniref:ABC transporter permease n=1 Tax=Paenibacillus sp. CF384 TaxID=1884382 RepID=UPI0008998940|nr:ABC transporter permease subunit [Paenibacillus sp. CF384]SDW91465.1 putative aldouronate transport system permease protein [Paenibacillus sp. CF384]